MKKLRAQMSPIVCTGYILEVLRDGALGSHWMSEEEICEAIARLSQKVSLKTVKKAIARLDGVLDTYDGRYRLSLKRTPFKTDTFVEARSRIAKSAKRAVAMHIHDNMIAPLDAMFIDAGSACEAVAREMAGGPKGHFTVVTNNMRAVTAFRPNRTIRVVLTGGYYIVDDEALVGPDAMFDSGRISVKYAIVGASGVTATHVYNHGILGEELIKKQYWRIPADELIVPVSLAKFGGRDASCFGELFRDSQRCENEARSVYEVDLGVASGSGRDGSAIHDIQEDEIAKTKECLWDALYSEEIDSRVPRFGSKKCTLVIEPQWMIDETFASKPDVKAALLSIVDEINLNSRVSGVSVVCADVSRERLAQ